MKSALEEFIDWGDEMMAKFPIEELDFSQALEKAKELVKKEEEVLLEYWNGGIDCTEEGYPNFYEFHRDRKAQILKLQGYLREVDGIYEVRSLFHSTPLHPDDVQIISDWKSQGINPFEKVIFHKRVIEREERKGEKPLVKIYAKLIEEQL